MSMTINGVVAALHAPRDESGAFDPAAFRANLELVLSHKVSGVCVNGASGEYAISTPDEKEQMLSIARERTQGRVQLVCGIGAATFQSSLILGRRALAIGADALLLPPPFGIALTPDDLTSYYREAARLLPGHVLLYQLPAYAHLLPPETITPLFAEETGLAGIKDSSGSLKVLSRLTSGGPNPVRLLGDDRQLGLALAGGLCDGIISGVAGVLPELILSIYESSLSGEAEQLSSGLTRLSQLLDRLDEFPAPWGLKLVAEGRGLLARPFFPVPLSPARTEQMRSFRDWYRDWSASLQGVQ